MLEGCAAFVMLVQLAIMPHIMYALDVDQALLQSYVFVCVCSSCHWGASNGQPLLPKWAEPKCRAAHPAVLCVICDALLVNVADELNQGNAFSVHLVGSFQCPRDCGQSARATCSGHATP